MQAIAAPYRPCPAGRLAILAAAALILLVAACGSSRPASSPGGSGSANSLSAIAYSRCMRSHGLPTWPDPTLDSEGRPGFNLAGQVRMNSGIRVAPVGDALGTADLIRSECGGTQGRPRLQMSAQQKQKQKVMATDDGRRRKAGGGS